MPGYSDRKAAVQQRLRRVEGQVRGVQRMVDDDAYCVDVLTQISAATKALQAVALELLDQHLAHCVADAIGEGGVTAEEKIAEASAAIARDWSGHEAGPVMSALVAFVSARDIWDSLREAFFMFWETLWALILGFTLSGAVQAFVSKRRMQQVMGDHSPGAVVRASGFGMVSSSCSYAATAMAKSLFQKGADFTSAMIFMFASTNLVVELGVVLLVLMGWQFALAEFVGGPIMIVGLALVGGFVFSPKLVRAARVRLDASAGEAHDHHHDHTSGDDDDVSSIKTRAGWSDAAGFTMSDVNMLRRELVVGYLVAGFLTMLVPEQWWNDVFLHGHGFWTTLENVVLGPLIAVISFVCSIGNVPMAAALWHGGIGFGGVVSFIFADLITIPLLLIYRKYYGNRLTLRIFATFYAVMVVAGLAVEGLFQVTGTIPTNRPEAVVPDRFAWNYTTFLNLAFLVVFGVLVWLARTRRNDAGTGRFATDPTCGMQVEKANAPAHLVHDGTEVWFCSDGCRDRYAATHEIGGLQGR